MKIVFVDVDGVLNSVASVITIGHSFPSREDKQRTFSPVSVGLLKRMVNECGLEIYCHSSWMSPRINDHKWFQDVLRRYDWPEAKVLESVSFGGDRGLRIEAALLKYRPEAFVILDDADMNDLFPDEMLWVDNRNGLSFEHYEKVLEKFGKQTPLVLI